MVGMTNDWGIDENNVKTIGKGGVQYIHTLWKAFKQKTKKIVMVEKRIFMLMARKTYAIFRYIHQIIIVVIIIIVITMGARVLCA